MRKSEITIRVEQARLDIDLIRRQLPQVLEKLDVYAANGFTNSAGDQVGGHGTGVPQSPVERAHAQPDEAAQYRQRLERRITDLSNAILDIKSFAAWAVHIDRENAGRPTRGCQIMAQVKVFEPATLTHAQGNLKKPLFLGQWARRFVVRNGRLPTVAEAERHAQGRDVRVA